MAITRHYLAGSAVMALFFMGFLLAVAAAPVRFDRSPLVIETKSGEKLSFTVELALTAPQREQGLMRRETMGRDEGMLFDFGISRAVMMWMKNTVLPLDMLFIDQNGIVRRIAANTVPFSENIVGSGDPVRYVLELNAGIAAERGIGPGDRVRSPAIPASAD